jgi:hypothetical protein
LYTEPPSPQQPPILWFDSRIISGFSELFAELQGKPFSLLWRCSRDGFKAQEFRRGCDGSTNNPTEILDMKGNIFRCFTQVKSDSSEEF